MSTIFEVWADVFVTLRKTSPNYALGGVPKSSILIMVGTGSVSCIPCERVSIQYVLNKEMRGIALTVGKQDRKNEYTKRGYIEVQVTVASTSIRVRMHYTSVEELIRIIGEDVVNNGF